MEIAGELCVLSALHLGAGYSRPLPASPAARTRDIEERGPPEVAAIARDSRDRPFLTGTTLKGALRRIAEAKVTDGKLDEETFKRLFGVIDDPSGSRMGSLQIRGAPEMKAADATGMPYAGAALGQGVFIAARTRIDRHSGSADDNTLHFQEMVAPQARFRLEVVLERRRRSAKAAELEAEIGHDLGQVIGILADLSEESGIAIGRGQADGQGRIRLDPAKVKITQHTVSAQGAFVPRDKTELWRKRAQTEPRAPIDTATFTLRCAGPFLVVDSSHEPTRDPDGGPSGPQVVAQRMGGQALLLGSGVTGALRARAAWLEALRRHRAGETISDSRVIDDPGKSNIADLTAVERLFGVTGFRGLLQVRDLKVASGPKAELTSVKLDRFSGAPIDNALYTTEAFTDVTIDLTLDLTGRPSTAPSQDERTLFRSLVKDVEDNGIMLGHGGNKGFGWFSPTDA